MSEEGESELHPGVQEQVDEVKQPNLQKVNQVIAMLAIGHRVIYFMVL